MFGLCCWKRACLSVGLAKLTGEVGPISQAPVDSHCFAGLVQAGVPFKHRSTANSELARTRGIRLSN